MVTMCQEQSGRQNFDILSIYAFTFSFCKTLPSIFQRQIALYSPCRQPSVDVTINSTSIKPLLRVKNRPIIYFGKVYDVDNPSAHVDNDIYTHKEKDKDRRKEESNHVYRLTYSVQHFICKDKITFGKTNKDKDKDKVLKRPNMCYILEKQETQGFQI